MRERQSGELKANPCRWRRSGSSLMMPRGSPKAGEAGRRQREEQGMKEWMEQAEPRASSCREAHPQHASFLVW